MITLTPWTEELLQSGERWAERDWRHEPQESRFEQHDEPQDDEDEERSK